jgi:hypothetical protein
MVLQQLVSSATARGYSTRRALVRCGYCQCWTAKAADTRCCGVCAALPGSAAQQAAAGGGGYVAVAAAVVIAWRNYRHHAAVDDDVVSRTTSGCLGVSLCTRVLGVVHEVDGWVLLQTGSTACQGSPGHELMVTRLT